MAEFNYNREQFIAAKSFILTALNHVAVANTSFNTLKTEIDTSYSTFFTEAGVIEETPTTDIVDLSSLAEKKTDFINIYKAVDELNKRMEKIRGAISKSVDPELDDLLKQAEAAMIAGEGGFIEIYQNHGLLDEMQLYELIKANLDNPYLELTDDQKVFVDAIINEGNARYEYENMTWYEKAGQGAIVFAVSVGEGIYDMGEDIYDGAIMIGSGATAYVVSRYDPEKADSILTTARAEVAKDYSGDWYDEVCEQLGVNELIKEGPCHKVGNAVGSAAGDAAILMLPGGAAVHSIITGVKEAGDYAEGKAGDNSVSNEELLVGTAANYAIGALKGAGKDYIKSEFVPSNPIEWQGNTMAGVALRSGAGYSAVNMGSTTAKAGVDYALTSENYEGVGDYVVKNDIPGKFGQDIVSGMGAGTIGAYSAGTSNGDYANEGMSKALYKAQTTYDDNNDYIDPIIEEIKDQADRHHSTYFGGVDRVERQVEAALGISARAEEAQPSSGRTAAEIKEQQTMDEVHQLQDLAGKPRT